MGAERERERKKVSELGTSIYLKTRTPIRGAPPLGPASELVKHHRKRRLQMDEKQKMDETMWMNIG